MQSDKSYVIVYTNAVFAFNDLQFSCLINEHNDIYPANFMRWENKWLDNIDEYFEILIFNSKVIVGRSITIMLLLHYYVTCFIPYPFNINLL